MQYDWIIIGGGPAGLFGAIQAGMQGNKVLLLEKNNTLGKKLLITGAGQCNITHGGDIKEFYERYGDNKKYIKKALDSFTNENVVSFFENKGLALAKNDKGKYFPKSMKAEDVLQLLINECKIRDVEIRCNQNVVKVGYEDEQFCVHTENKTYFSKKILIATGGKSYPKTGSNGDGYTLAKHLGHRIIEPKPALTPIIIKNNAFSNLSGVSLQDVPMTLWRNNKKMRNFLGDIVFTHRGISGPAVLNNSRWMEVSDVITMNFIACKNVDELRKQMAQKLMDEGKMQIKTFFKRYDIPQRLREQLLRFAQIDGELQCAKVSKKQRNQLIEALTAYPVEIEQLGGFHIAMVTKGGIAWKQVNPTTMESRVIRGLYFAGEVLDVDGDTGGYNIQVAFSTAVLAVKSSEKDIK